MDVASIVDVDIPLGEAEVTGRQDPRPGAAARPQASTGERPAGSGELEAFLRERFSTTLEDPQTGRKVRPAWRDQRV